MTRMFAAIADFEYASTNLDISIYFFDGTDDKNKNRILALKNYMNDVVEIRKKSGFVPMELWRGEATVSIYNEENQIDFFRIIKNENNPIHYYICKEYE